MPENNVVLEIQGSIAHVTLNRPDVHNAFDEETINDLSDIFDKLAQLSDVTVVILRGAGKSFSAGGDLNWMKRAAHYTEAENYEDGLRLATMLHKLYSLPQLTIACVQGAAMGGGMGLVCCCDIVLAQADTKFALSEVKLGLIPATIGPYVIRAIGERQAKRYFQTGERIDCTKARDMHLVHEIFDTAEAMDKSLNDILDAVKSNAPQAMKAAKILCSDLAGQGVSDEIQKDTACRIARIRAGAEAQEGLSAFLEKRQAGWVRE